MRLFVRGLAALLPIVLLACVDDDAALYRPPPPSLTPAAISNIRVGSVDTGFLFFGNTRIFVDSVDGKRLYVDALNGPRRLGDPDKPTPIVPGVHAVMIRAFRDPVEAFACIRADFEAGKTYVVQSTKPEMDKTTIWLEDEATGKLVGEKSSARMIRDPALWGPGLKALFVDPIPTTC